ncbi:MAG: DUF561 domain-containing protein [Eubacteriales bacterium]
MKLNTLLKIKYPILQGGMANIATGKFAAAVSNAGGLGIIGCGGLTTEQLREEIHVVREHLTDKSTPFGVNIMLLNPCAEEISKMVVEEKVPVLTTGAGNPASYLPMWKEAGILVFPVVASVALAKRLEKYGADGLIAEGMESGGHVGETTTMALVHQVVEAVDIPVIAAGGVGSGAQMAAALAMGASGVQVGTCLLVSDECPIHENYKQAVIKAKDSSTTVTGRSVGVPVRLIKNKMAREYLNLEKTITDKMELEKLTLGSLRKAVFDGDVEMGSLMAGQVAGQMTEIRPVATILAELDHDCKARLQQTTKLWG